MSLRGLATDSTAGRGESSRARSAVRLAHDIVQAGTRARAGRHTSPCQHTSQCWPAHEPAKFLGSHEPGRHTGTSPCWPAHEPVPAGTRARPAGHTSSYSLAHEPAHEPVLGTAGRRTSPPRPAHEAHEGAAQHPSAGAARRTDGGLPREGPVSESVRWAQKAGRGAHMRQWLRRGAEERLRWGCGKVGRLRATAAAQAATCGFATHTLCMGYQRLVAQTAMSLRSRKPESRTWNSGRGREGGDECAGRARAPRHGTNVREVGAACVPRESQAFSCQAACRSAWTE